MKKLLSDDIQVLTQFVIEEKNNIPCVNQPVHFGVMFPYGSIRDADYIKFHTLESEPIRTQKKITALWPDKSIQWLQCCMPVTLHAAQVGKFQIVIDKKKDASGKCEDDYPILQVPPEGEFRPFDAITYKGKKIVFPWTMYLTEKNGTSYKPIISHLELQDDGEIYQIYKTQGYFVDNKKNEIRFTSVLYNYKCTPCIRMCFQIHNTRSATHRDNFWDLGDESSLFFTDLSLKLSEFTSSDVHFSTNCGCKPVECTGRTVEMLQQSSGGAHWNSSNHVNFNKRIDRVVQGALVNDGKSEYSENRIQPEVTFHVDDLYVSAGISEFWQNFPKKIKVSNDSLELSLFPKQNNELYELQGGESKVHTILFSVKDDIVKPSTFLSVGLIPIFPAEWYQRCGIYKFFSQPSANDDLRLFDPVKKVVIGSETFFHRREITDEYGWRNFGDIYADHESAYNPPDQPFNSHYNNQYDGIFWSLMHFFRSGNTEYFNLSHKLAQHVADIDVYKTKNDRLEFNGGMFWHTNHYVDASTSSHRCYSKDHKSNGGIAPSGGPSPQNCYIAGLILDYYLTGDPFVGDAISSVVNNISNILNGPQKIFANISYTAKRLLKKNLKKYGIVKGPYNLFDGPGRESANALLALLHGYTFLHDEKLLHQAEKLIRICISPMDNIQKRNLDDVEMRWSYVMFLQALGTYLCIKTQINQIDQMFNFAKDTLFKYALWMVDNESPYLECKNLEYPNETWAAQELRKSCVFYYASLFSDSKKDLFRKNAENYYDVCFEFFNKFGDRRYLVRPLVLLMANGLLPTFFRNRDDFVDENKKFSLFQ